MYNIKGHRYYAIINFGKCIGINQISVFALENGAGPSLLAVAILWVPAELKLHLVVEICFSSTQIIAVLLRNFTGCILEGLYCMHVNFLRFTVLGIHCGMVTGNKGH